MTTPQEARKAAIGFHVTSGISKILHGLADQLEAATADRDACKMDAARYQKLVDFCHIEYVPEEPWQLVIWEPPTGEDWKAKLDAAIDAAIAKGANL